MEILTQVALPLSLMLIMVGVGLGLELGDFRRVFRQPSAFMLGALCQMICLPAVALLVIGVLNLEGELAIGLFILSLCPGGTTSNLYSLIAKADVGLSVSLTAVVGFIAPFTIPIVAMWGINHLSDQTTDLVMPWLETWLKLMIITVIPVVVGMLIRYRFKNIAMALEAKMHIFSAAVLGLVVLSIGVSLGDTLLDYIRAAGPAALMLNLVTMGLGYVVGRLFLASGKQARTICLEVGLQNGTLAIVITTGILNSL